MIAGKIKDRSDKTAWAEYRPGFEVEIRFCPRARLSKISEQAKKTTWSNKTHLRVETVDNQAFYRLMAEEVLVDWRGLTPEILKQMIDMEEYPKGDVPFDTKDAAELMEKAYDFDMWVQDVCTSLEMIEAARKAAEQKNSLPLPAES